MVEQYWVETLGCPKNQVDSDKLIGQLEKDGLQLATNPTDADLVVVNTCAFIDKAREESVETILELTSLRKPGARLVVTGCMAQRYGDELANALPEVDQVSGFGVPVNVLSTKKLPRLDLLNLPRPKSTSPWAYVKIAEGCDRACGFCAIPSFRGKQRSRSVNAILQEVDELEAQEIVLIAQDIAAFGRDTNESNIVQLVQAIAQRVRRVRLLYLYPSDLNDELMQTILSTGVAYFDLSLQHVSASLLRRMRRWGNGPKFMERIEAIRKLEPTAAFRSNFIVGYPGETEDDHDELVRFVQAADLEWCSFFAYSPEEGTYATTLDGEVPQALMEDRLAELRELQDIITARKRMELIGEHIEVLVDAPGVARGFREAPEIDGIVEVPEALPVGEFATVRISGCAGPDLEATEQ